jgi:7-carboxy-7-deazaguanine synthase
VNPETKTTRPGAPDGSSTRDNSLVVNEVYTSIQGESTYAGEPCVFVRLTGCNLRCEWCDTTYAFHEGGRRTVADVVSEVLAYELPTAEITGGEPLLQPAVHPLMTALADAGKRVLLETSGSLDISAVDPRVIRIVDIKCPDSGEVEKNRWENMEHIRGQDELKFVLAGRRDYEWARKQIQERGLTDLCTVLLGPVWGSLQPQELARWILEDGLAVRFQTQLHKYIWSPNARGV